MKRTSYLLGLISCLIIFIGAMFKMQHWPGASIMLISGILLFVVIFLPVSLIHHYNMVAGKKNFWLHAVTFITGLVIFTSALFKTLHWPGAGTLLLFSIPFPFLVFLPVYIYSSRRNKTPISEYASILMLLLFYALTASLLSLTISKNLTDEGAVLGREWTNSEQVFNNVAQTLLNESIESKNPEKDGIEKIHIVANKLCSDINDLILKVSTTVNTNNIGAIDKDGIVDYSKLAGMDATVSINDIEGGSEKGSELKNQIMEFKNALLTNTKVKNSPAKELIESLLNTSPVNEISWDDDYLLRLHLVWEIQSLQSIKGKIRFCEAQALKILAKS